jgi:hypothetical protein
LLRQAKILTASTCTRKRRSDDRWISAVGRRLPSIRSYVRSVWNCTAIAASCTTGWLTEVCEDFVLEDPSRGYKQNTLVRELEGID